MASTTEKSIARLQFLTMDDAPAGHLQQIEAACRAGIRWVQLRMKNAEPEVFLEMAIGAKKICDDYGSVLIINDRVEIAQAVKAHGVHLGKLDMPVADARRLLGDDFIIGGTANTAVDIEMHRSQGADYIGLGPFRYTATKKNLSPVLGKEGYSRIMAKLRMNELERADVPLGSFHRTAPVPVLAIGGIKAGDLGPLLIAGVYGIAFSGMFLFAADRPALIKTLNAELHSSLSIIHYADDRG